MRGVETEWGEAWWHHWGWETSFAGPGGTSANPEARRSFLRDHGASAPPPSNHKYAKKTYPVTLEIIDINLLVLQLEKLFPKTYKISILREIYIRLTWYTVFESLPPVPS